MSDNVLLTSLWLVPLIGMLVVLAMPKRNESAIRWVSLGFTSVTLRGHAGGPGELRERPTARRPLEERASNNTLARGPDELTVQRGRRRPSATWSSAGLDPVVQYSILPGARRDQPEPGRADRAGRVLACLASWNIDKQVKGYYALYLLLTASMIGVFLSLDLFLFYVFFEVMLLPMYFLIGIWGGPRREYAAIKFLLYTLFGSVFILVAILILYFYAGDATCPGSTGHSFDIVLLAKIASETSYYGRNIQCWVFLLFFIGFIVKLPSFPFHTWLPDAHVEAPTPISMILAGILLKIGGYGLIRLAWPLAPAGAYDWSYCVAGAGGLQHPLRRPRGDGPDRLQEAGRLQLGQPHGLRHPGNGRDELRGRRQRYYAYGVNGAMYMMLAHGITSAGMFFLVGVIYDRAHTRDLNKLGGLDNIMPLYGALSYIIFFGSMGLPGLCGFVAEVFVVLAAFNYVSCWRSWPPPL